MITRLYHAYDPPPAVDLECKDRSLTQQSEAKDADINTIVARFEKTGILPAAQREGLFLDVSNMPDYRQALDQVNQTNQYFMTLPAKTRLRFNNDAAEFLDFISDGNNKNEAIELGLLPKEENDQTRDAPKDTLPAGSSE